MMKDICKVLNADLESVLNGEYDSFANIDYDEKLYWVRICRHDVLSAYVPTNNTNIKWDVIYTLYFGRDENCSTKIAEFRFFDGEPKKHIVNQMSQIILHWISKTRIKKPKEKKCEFKYLDEDEARINKASENLGIKFEIRDDHLYFQEDTMTNMTKAELEQKYWEAQRKIDEYERERDRFLKDIDERDQSISDLIDANEKLTKENDKLSVDISREKDKHDAATEKCKELTKDTEFWKEKAYEMDKKNCELRSRNRELEKELDEEKCKLVRKVEFIPETYYQIDILQKKVEKLESDNESYELENNDLVCSLAHKTRQIEKLEEKNTELENALEAAELKARKNWINSRFGRMGYFDTDMIDNKKNPKEFREILVRECFGRPYYEILYKEDGQMHVGYSSYKLDKVSEWLKEFFID